MWPSAQIFFWVEKRGSSDSGVSLQPRAVVRGTVVVLDKVRQAIIVSV